MSDLKKSQIRRNRGQIDTPLEIDTPLAHIQMTTHSKAT